MSETRLDARQGPSPSESRYARVRTNNVLSIASEGHSVRCLKNVGCCLPKSTRAVYFSRIAVNGSVRPGEKAGNDTINNFDESNEAVMIRSERVILASGFSLGIDELIVRKIKLFVRANGSPQAHL